MIVRAWPTRLPLQLIEKGVNPTLIPDGRVPVLVDKFQCSFQLLDRRTACLNNLFVEPSACLFERFKGNQVLCSGAKFLFKPGRHIPLKLKIRFFKLFKGEPQKTVADGKQRRIVAVWAF